MTINTAQTVISIPARKILQGKNFTSNDNRDIGASSTFRYGITTGDEQVHFGYTVSLELGGEAAFYQNSNHTGAITNPILNMNQNDTITTTNVIILRNVGLGTLGDLWDEQYIDPGATINSSSKVGARIEEFILKPNSEYILNVVNPIASLNKVTITFGWYDVE